MVTPLPLKKYRSSTKYVSNLFWKDGKLDENSLFEKLYVFVEFRVLKKQTYGPTFKLQNIESGFCPALACLDFGRTMSDQIAPFDICISIKEWIGSDEMNRIREGPTPLSAPLAPISAPMALLIDLLLPPECEEGLFLIRNIA